MGLRLSEAKTLITHIDEGLDFLGWHLQRHRKRGTNRCYVYTYPSRIERHCGAFLLGVRRHQGGVDVEDDGVAEVGVGDLRRREPVGQLGPDVGSGPWQGPCRSV